MELRISISREGQIIGDYTKEEIASFFDNGNLKTEKLLPEDHYWMEGMIEWKPVSEIPSNPKIQIFFKKSKPKKKSTNKITFVLGVATIVFLILALVVPSEKSSQNDELLNNSDQVDAAVGSKEMSTIRKQSSSDNDLVKNKEKTKFHPLIIKPIINPIIPKP